MEFKITSTPPINIGYNNTMDTRQIVLPANIIFLSYLLATWTTISKIIEKRISNEDKGYAFSIIFEDQKFYASFKKVG